MGTSSFVQVMKDWRRMCADIRCHNCSFYDFCDGVPCVDPYIAQETITKWAAEHPAPVYPTWGEWLKNNVQSITVLRGFPDPDDVYDIILHSPIPADIAQKLGIEPKEG